MRKMNIRRPMCVICLIFVFFIYLILTICGSVDINKYANDFETVEITGKVTDKVYKNDKYSIHIKCKSKNRNNSKYIVYLDNQNAFDFKIGQIVNVRGKYQNFTAPENDGQFDMRRYYRIRGYEASVTKACVVMTGKKYSYIRECLFNIKTRTKEIYKRYMGESEAGTLSAMALGDKADLDTGVKDMYQAAGISHVLSLSGLHIAAVGMCFFSILRAIGAKTPVCAAIAGTIMSLYGLMTGFSTSTIRALIMFVLAVIAKSVGRTYDLLSGMSLASILILFENPYYVFDSGFRLSVLSVCGISMLYPMLMEITDFFKEDKGVLYERTRQSICISLATNLATLPVALDTFYKISRYSIFINIIVVPLMSVILSIGIVVLIIGNTVIRLSPFDGIVRGLLFAAEKVIDLYSLLCEKTANLYGNCMVTGKGAYWQNTIYIIFIVTAVLLYEKYRGKIRFDERHRAELRKKLMICEIVIITSAFFIITARRNSGLSINALSVGQGACNVIYGENIPTVMIDAGSTDVKDIYKYRIRPFLLSHGIDEIDYLFITHPDEDHINGVIELLENDVNEVDIKHIFMSVYDEKTTELAAARNIETHIIGQGDKIRNGALTIECISPAGVKESVGDLNDCSLVLRVSFAGKKRNYTALFTGDISSDVEHRLVDDKNVSAKLKRMDFLSVAHHGSKNSSSKEFIELVNADVCTVSAGRNNSYGHPHKETLERFKNYSGKTHMFRTDKSGQITVTVDGDRVYARGFLR